MNVGPGLRAVLGEGAREMGSQEKIVILIATQKLRPFPEDSMYLPVHVGAALQEPVSGLTPDCTGEQISSRNRNYCELTGMYWAWKNLKADYVGLNHYRRFFARPFPFWQGKAQRIAGRQEIDRALAKAPVILPKKRHYYIETTYTQYIHSHHAQDLELTRAILQETYPEYTASFDRVMGRTSGHRFNMFVMRWDYFDQYCQWLFDVLFRLEQRLDISGYSAYDQRVFGFVAERLMDVWLDCRKVPYTELPVVFTDKQNWPKKITAFLLRKIRGSRKEL